MDEMAENPNENVSSKQDDARVISIIQNMFGDKIAFDLIWAVVENCAGDLESSVDAILSILQVDTTQNEPDTTVVSDIKPQASAVVTLPQTQSSFKDILCKSVNTLAKESSNVNMYKSQSKYPSKTYNGCENELNTIIMYHGLGYRTLIIMRGLPGSGKSFLSRHIVDATVGPDEKNYKAHIFSTDDYFVMRGFYSVQLIDEAHKWNHRRVEVAVTQGLSPVIVDNTNTELWEMEVYVRAGVKEGYFVMVLEPKTPWSKNLKQLARKNIHGVSEQKISRMAYRYQPIKKDTIIDEFGLKYAANKAPPILRNIPLFPSVENKISNQQNHIACTLKSINSNDETSSSANTCSNSTASIPGCSSSVIGVISQEGSTSHTHHKSSCDYSVASITDQMSKINETCVIKMCEDSPNGNVKDVGKNINDQPLQSNTLDLRPSSNVNNLSLEKCSSEDILLPQNNVRPKNTPVEALNPTICNDAENIGMSLECAPVSVVMVDENLSIQTCEEDKSNQSADNQQEDKEDEIRRARLAIAEKKIEELKKFEDEWEMGGDWVEVDNTGNATEVTESLSAPKPQRRRGVSLSSDSETLMPIIEKTKNWQDIARFMPSWDHDFKETEDKSEISVEMTSHGTSIEFEDWDKCNSKYKVISSFDRDINLYYMPNDEIRSIKKMRLDNSTQVNEDMIYSAYRCKNEEKHFKALCKVFKNIPKSNLREIFNKCHSDVHWTVDLLLEAGNQSILNFKDTSDSDDNESEDDHGCDCFKFVSEKEVQVKEYIPQCENVKENTNVSSPSPLVNKQRKGKTPYTKLAMELKKELEQNVVISDDHYSEHCLKIRKMRQGDFFNLPGTSQVNSNLNQVNLNVPPDYIGSSDYNNHTDDDDNESFHTEETETVNVNLGRDFIVNLDKLFNRKVLYSEHIMPVVNMPVSLLNQINALWLESYAHQLDSQAAYSDILVNEDQELARQLSEKEAELAREGKDPEVPDFKEIMDMDFAMALYQKDVAEWQNSKPNDLAAKMTRDKLYNLFPELPPETLVEVLMAHENNFQATVETLLMSTGQSSVLQEENGVNKFIMNKEMAQRKIVEEQRRQALEEEEFPLLTKMDPNVALSIAEEHRSEALVHLGRRKMIYNKAQDFVRRGMTEVASYYTDVATFHKNQFERSNHYAASYFIHSHAASRDKSTMDLHFLFVPEAMEALDLFLDHHIMTLRKKVASSNQNRPATIFLITGRGSHSPGGPRIKPAAKRRLRQRGVSWYELNPGLLSIYLTADDLMTHQIFP